MNKIPLPIRKAVMWVIAKILGYKLGKLTEDDHKFEGL